MSCTRWAPATAFYLAAALTTAEAVVNAGEVIAKFTTRNIGTLEQRLAKAGADGAAKTAAAH